MLFALNIDCMRPNTYWTINQDNPGSEIYSKNQSNCSSKYLTHYRFANWIAVELIFINWKSSGYIHCYITRYWVSNACHHLIWKIDIKICSLNTSEHTMNMKYVDYNLLIIWSPENDWTNCIWLWERYEYRNITEMLNGWHFTGPSVLNIPLWLMPLYRSVLLIPKTIVHLCTLGVLLMVRFPFFHHLDCPYQWKLLS